MLTRICAETRKIPGLENVADYRIIPFNGRVSIHLFGSSVRKIPAYFHASGYADFSNCRALTSIGDHFHAGGHANFRECDALEGFNAGAYIGKDLRLADSSLMCFPPDITIGGRIHDIPDSFTKEALQVAWKNCPGLSHAAKENIRAYLRDRGVEVER